MVFSDDVQLNPDLSINQFGRVRKRKRIRKGRLDVEEGDNKKIYSKQVPNLRAQAGGALVRWPTLSEKALSSNPT